MAEVLATQDGQIIEAKDRAAAIGKFLEMNQDALAKALPKHMQPERLMRVAITTIRGNQKLMNCSLPSLIGAFMESAQLGLEIGKALGHAWLVPYGKHANFQIGYRGMVDLAMRSGKVATCFAVCVHKMDKFRVIRGTDPSIEHEQSMEANRTIPPTYQEAVQVITHVYAVSRMKDGSVAFEVMNTAEIEKVRDRSRAGNDGPWITDWPEMAKKTVFRRLFKWLPVSVEMQRAVTLDESIDAGMDQVFNAVPGVDFNVVEEPEAEEPKKAPAKKKAASKKKKAKPKPEPEPEKRETEKEEESDDDEAPWDQEEEPESDAEEETEEDDEFDNAWG